MKTTSNIFLTGFILIFSSFLCTTTIKGQNAPNVDWFKEDYAPNKWDGSLKPPQNDPSHKHSDDWWYGHIKIYETNPATGHKVHVGYAAAGYSSWQEAKVSLLTQNQCFEFDVDYPVNSANNTDYTPKCEDFETNNSIKGHFFQTIARYALDGTMIWCKRFNAGEFHSLVQDENDNIVAIGQSESVAYMSDPANNTWEFAGYNPANDNQGTIVTCTNTDDWKLKLSVVKVNMQSGAKIWNYMYGQADISNSNWKSTPTKGWGIINYKGGFRVVGNNNGQGFMLQLEDDGDIQQKQVYSYLAVGTEFFGIDAAANGNILVSGWLYYGGSNKGYLHTFPADNSFLVSSANQHIFDYRTTNTPKGTKVISLKYLKAFDKFIVPVFYNGSFVNWNGEASLELQLYNSDFTLASTTPYQAGIYNAYDLKVGIAEVMGGFATVSTKVTRAPYTSIPTNIQSLINNVVPNCSHYTNLDNYKRFGADASVARYQIDNNNDITQLWSQDYDPKPQTPQAWPNDIKSQECLYTITADDANEALVVVGNSSSNFDDGYLLKLNPEDCPGLTYDYSDPSGIYEVTGTEFWDGNKTVQGQVIVKAGASLFILPTNNTSPGLTSISFASSLKTGVQTGITVEKGGELYVFDATLKADDRCPNSSWDGIRILGDNSLDQLTLSNQGFVELNNVTIEGVDNALSFGEPGVWNDFGGIVFAEDVTFKVNKRAMALMSYPNFNNRSYFLRCNFEYMPNLSHMPFSLVTAWDNHGVKFYGCTFNNTSGVDDYSDNNVNGIFTADATISVLPACATNSGPNNQACYTGPNEVRSQFINLNQGLHITTAGGATRVATVENADFIDNAIAMRVEKMDNARFINNTVQSGGAPKAGFIGSGIDDWKSQVGFFAREASGFEVEDNEFEKTTNTEASIGVQIINSGAVGNEVYRNTFKGQDFGQKFDWLNKGTDNFVGLQSYCNTNPTPNTVDINIDKGAGLPIVTDAHGIRTLQGGGLNSYAQMNVFSTVNTYRIENKSAQNINYYYSAGVPIEDPKAAGAASFDPVVPIANTWSTSCPVRYAQQRFNGNPRPLTGIIAPYYTMRAQYDNLLYAYYQNIDGGNTEALINAINLTFPAGAVEFRDELMQEAPYLSQEALMDAAAQGILTDALLLEICLANPEATYGEDFLNFIEFEIPNPLPSSMIQLIYQNWDAETPRTLLEHQLATLNAELSHQSSQLINYYASDTLDYSDSIENILKSRKDVPSAYQLVELALEKNNFELANERLNNIVNQNELTEYQLEEHNNFVSYIGFRQSIWNDNRTYMQLSEGELVELRVIADANTGKTSAMARNILCFGYSECDRNIEEPQEPLGRKRAPREYDFNKVVSIENTAINAGNQTFTLFPNPTNESITVKIANFNEESAYQYQINTIDGKLMLNGTSQKERLKVDVSQLSKGSYIFVLFESGKQVGQTVLAKQ